MAQKKYFFTYGLVLLILSSFSFSQSQKKAINPGIGFEYFKQKIGWDEDKYTTNLTSHFLTLNTEFKIQEGFFVNLAVGYSSSNFDSLIFRELPISLELEVGGISGYLLGTELRKRLFRVRDFEIEAQGQFLYSSGSQREWEIPGLNVKATAVGKPWWMRVLAGPAIKYAAFNHFFPYLLVSYNKVWGKFKLKQEIEDIGGTEEKRVTGKSNINISVGAIYELTKAFSIKAELSFFPYKDEAGFGFATRVMYSL